MRVLITGPTGLIGAALTDELMQRGHEAIALNRDSGSRDRATQRPGGEGPSWDIDGGWIDEGALDGIDAIVHLAGAPVGKIGKRWSTAMKHEIMSSRTAGTSLIARAAAEAKTPVLVSGSAIGFYGDRGDEILTEQSSPGSGFLANVVQAWEEAAAPAAESGCRTVFIRTGIVLDDAGGSLQPMLIPFKLGLGGNIGSGRQYWAWITLHDEVRAILHCLETDTLTGPVNLTAPNPVPNSEFADALGRALHRPSMIPAPSFALKALLGAQFVDEVLLASQRVTPPKLIASGFEFEHETVEPALRSVLA